MIEDVVRIVTVVCLTLAGGAIVRSVVEARRQELLPRSVWWLVLGGTLGSVAEIDVIYDRLSHADWDWTITPVVLGSALCLLVGSFSIARIRRR